MSQQNHDIRIGNDATVSTHITQHQRKTLNILQMKFCTSNSSSDIFCHFVLQCSEFEIRGLISSIFYII